MNSNILKALLSSVGLVNTLLQGKKRWVSLLAYALLAVATVAGFPIGDLAKEVALDPEIQKDSTLIAIATAAGITFRFFQSMGRARDVGKQVSDLEARLERNNLK
jgi:hypothetical protein